VAWREAVARSRTDEGLADAPGPWEPERWVRDDLPPAPAPAPAPGANKRARTTSTARTNRPSQPDEPTAGPGGGRKPKELPPEVASELHDEVGGAKAARFRERLTAAAGAYERDRYRDAARMLKPLAEQAPGSGAVRELYGLTLYRLGRWDAAAKELEAYRALTSESVDQHPTLADCYRAKKRWKRVDELWDELRHASPAPELLAEGRLVQAGSLADRGRIEDAIELLEAASKKSDVRKPKDHHVRTWYALADLYERAGEVPRARELFRRVRDHDVDGSYDAADRLDAIG
jgi:tetratricopeptide (TPR) repeat protein